MSLSRCEPPDRLPGPSSLPDIGESEPGSPHGPCAAPTVRLMNPSLLSLLLVLLLAVIVGLSIALYENLSASRD